MQAILTIAILAALIWGALLLLRGNLLAGCIAVLISASCLSSYFAEIPAKPMPITLDRILWAVLLGQYILWRRFGKTAPKAFTSVDGLLLAFFGWLAISCATHSGEVSPLPRLFFSYMMPLGLYWIARQANISERAYKYALIALVALGAYLAITAVGEVYGISWLVYPKYILDPPYSEFEGRARGPYLNPVANGLAICLAILSAVYLLKAAPRRWRPLLIVLLPAFLGTIYLTQTRCVWLGSMAAIGILVLVRIPREKRVATVVYFSLLGLVVMASQWESLLSFKRDKELTAEETRKSAELRPILATMAWKMFKDHPLDGVGLSQYDENSERYLKKIEYGLPLEEARGYTQHNVFLSLLTETGLIGMAMFIAILVFWTYHALQLYKDVDRPDWLRYQGLLCLAFLGAYLPNAMFQDVSQIAMVNMFLFFVAGLMMNFRLREDEVKSLKLEV